MTDLFDTPNLPEDHMETMHTLDELDTGYADLATRMIASLPEHDFVREFRAIPDRPTAAEVARVANLARAAMARLFILRCARTPAFAHRFVCADDLGAYLDAFVWTHDRRGFAQVFTAPVGMWRQRRTMDDYAIYRESTRRHGAPIPEWELVATQEAA